MDVLGGERPTDVAEAPGREEGIDDEQDERYGDEGGGIEQSRPEQGDPLDAVTTASGAAADPMLWGRFLPDPDTQLPQTALPGVRRQLAVTSATMSV